MTLRGARPWRRLASLGVAAMLASQGAVAQTPPVSPSTPPAVAKGRETVVPPGGQVNVRGPERLPAVDQLSRNLDRGTRSTQLAPRAPVRQGVAQVSGVTREPIPTVPRDPTRRTTQATTQLSRGPATAAASEPLSSPAQGRRQATERLSGRDRCDPQTTTAVGVVPATSCARVIETRSGEFVRADPLVLSPEQRLLVDQRLRDGPSTSQSAAQRIGKNEIDPTSMDVQGLASLALAIPVGDSPVPVGEQTDAQAAATSLVEAIIGGIGVNGPGTVIPPR